jgi:hypothetical protein
MKKAPLAIFQRGFFLVHGEKENAAGDIMASDGQARGTNSPATPLCNPGRCQPKRTSFGTTSGDNNVSHAALIFKHNPCRGCTKAARFQPHLNILLNISAETAKTARSRFAQKSAIKI